MVIRIPARRESREIASLALWLCFWLAVEVASIAGLFHLSPEKELPAICFLGFWTLFWTSSGLLDLFAIAWQLAGREVITLSSRSLSLRREIAGIGLTRHYERSGIRRLRVEAAKSTYPPRVRARINAMGLSGAIAFDYGGRTRRCGLGLDEEEAYSIITPIAARF